MAEAPATQPAGRFSTISARRPDRCVYRCTTGSLPVGCRRRDKLAQRTIVASTGQAEPRGVRHAARRGDRLGEVARIAYAGRMPHRNRRDLSNRQPLSRRVATGAVLLLLTALGVLAGPNAAAYTAPAPAQAAQPALMVQAAYLDLLDAYRLPEAPSQLLQPALDSLLKDA